MRQFSSLFIILLIVVSTYAGTCHVLNVGTSPNKPSSMNNIVK